MPEIPQHILFDLDGTLTDPFEGITGSVQYALEKMGIQPPEREALRPFIGPPLGVSFAEFYGMNDEEIAAAVGYYREYFSTEGIRQNELFPGMDALLRDLAASGRALHLATSKPLYFARQILQHFGLDGHFASAHGSTMSGHGAPKAEIVAEVLREEGIAPQNALMVGDTIFDIEGAAACGVPAVGVAFGNTAPAVLREAGAVAVAGTVEELRGILLPEGGEQNGKG